MPSDVLSLRALNRALLDRQMLLCRTPLLKTCGSPIHRIMLSGGPTDIWLNDEAPQLTAIVNAVDDALRDGCERWQVARPAVTLTPAAETSKVLVRSMPAA